MKKLLFIGFILLLVVVAVGQRPHYTEKKDLKPETAKMIGKTVVTLSKTDNDYVRYGYYKYEFRRYNYEYNDSTFSLENGVDEKHSRDCYVNEYGDTTTIIYVDYTNYPHR